MSLPLLLLVRCRERTINGGDDDGDDGEKRRRKHRRQVAKCSLRGPNRMVDGRVKEATLNEDGDDHLLYWIRWDWTEARPVESLSKSWWIALPRIGGVKHVGSIDAAVMMINLSSAESSKSWWLVLQNRVSEWAEGVVSSTFFTWQHDLIGSRLTLYFFLLSSGENLTFRCSFLLLFTFSLFLFNAPIL